MLGSLKYSTIDVSTQRPAEGCPSKKVKTIEYLYLIS